MNPASVSRKCINVRLGYIGFDIYDVTGKYLRCNRVVVSDMVNVWKPITRLTQALTCSGGTRYIVCIR